MLKCEICGCEFDAMIEKHYISTDERKIGLAAVSGGTRPLNTTPSTALNVAVSTSRRKEKEL